MLTWLISLLFAALTPLSGPCDTLWLTAVCGG